MSHDNEEPERAAGTEQEASQTHTGRSATGAAPRLVDSTELFAGCSELIIVHAQEHYRLRITRNDKLILTK
jgi:hemin uptake protein HemP